MAKIKIAVAGCLGRMGQELSKQILSGKIISDSIILLDCFDDKLVFRNQSDLKIKS